jgi:L-aspartate oxidase
VACSGVHGANRLASNSLLEGLVFGRRAAIAAVAYAKKQRGAVGPLPSVRELDGGHPASLEDAEKLRSSLRRVMWGKVGLARTGDSLAAALGQLSRWERLVSRPFASRLALEVKSMVQVARCVAEAALWRTNSVGAHYRADYPSEKRPGWNQHSLVLRGSEKLKVKSKR